MFVFLWVKSPERETMHMTSCGARHALINCATAISAGPACGKSSHGGTRKD
jgi:hypothetical protein